MKVNPEAQPGDDLDAAADAAIATCGGDPRAAVRALIVANGFLTERLDALTRELDEVWRWVSPGYSRSTNRRRMRTGDPE